MRRCSWCAREARDLFAFADACPVHRPTARAILNHLWRVIPRGPRSDAHLLDVRFAREALTERDARELRGERIDWTQPVPGWTIFG